MEMNANSWSWQGGARLAQPCTGSGRANWYNSWEVTQVMLSEVLKRWKPFDLGVLPLEKFDIHLKIDRDLCLWT